MIKPDSWHKCYQSGWGKRLTPESYSHPAKGAFNLAERIYQHAIEEGWLESGQTVLDPFGGIGGFAYHAMKNGLNFIGMELELKFQRLGQGMDCPGYDAAYWRRYNGRGKKWNELNICPACARLLDDPGKPVCFFGAYRRAIPVR